MTETAEQRRRIMRAVKGKDTGPEMLVRRLTHGLGYRYRLHAKELPGKPDMAFRPRKKVIFMHGCFWHGHQCKRGDRTPKNNRTYWKKKISRNRERDRENMEALRRQGWRALVVWECETKDVKQLAERIRSFLNHWQP